MPGRVFGTHRTGGTATDPITSRETPAQQARTSFRHPQVERRTHDYIRNGVTDLFAALDIATGQVLATTRRRHRALEFKQFLNAIDKAVPAALDVHVLLDNSSTHKTPEIHRWLLRHTRFHLHFTPTSSS